MKELWEKIKEGCRANKEAVCLMAAFIVFFCVISGPEIAKEASSARVTLQTEQTETAETDTEETDTETETGAETETAAMTETETESETEERQAGPDQEALRMLFLKYGSAFQIPMVTPEEAVPYRILDARFCFDGHPAPEHAQKARSFTVLEEQLAQRISEYDGDWSVYIKDLGTGEVLMLNDRPMKSASVMKLFIMGTVYKAFESGELERTDTVMSLVEQMITVSDNESSNDLLYRLGDGSYERGIEKVDAFIREYGFSDMTVEYNGFNNPATNLGSGNFNQVSAKDCGKLLEDIYRRTWVSRKVSNEMEQLLLNQHTRYKIPAGLPEGVLCGNKTGEMDTTENDAAIIYAPGGDYILVVLSSDWNSKDQAISRIKTISEEVYEFLGEE